MHARCERRLQQHSGIISIPLRKWRGQVDGLAAFPSQDSSNQAACTLTSRRLLLATEGALSMDSSSLSCACALLLDRGGSMASEHRAP